MHFVLKTSKQIGKERRIAALDELVESARISKTWNGLKNEMYKNGYHFILSENVKGINGARIIPINQFKPDHQLSEREKVSRKGYKLSQLSRTLKIHDIAHILENNRKKINIKTNEKLSVKMENQTNTKKLRTIRL